MSCLECYICKTKDPPLFEFPYGSMLFDWLNNINVKITAYNLDMRLCSIHFEKHYISTSKAKLSKKAVPTLCLGPGVSTKSNSQKRVWNRGCCIPECKTDRKSGIRLFSFPRDERRRDWIFTTGIKCNVEDECELEPHEIDMIVKPKKPITDVRTINKTCSVPGCDTNNLTNLRLFGFPKDERFEVWKESVGRSQSKRKKLYACVLHFDSRHRMNSFIQGSTGNTQTFKNTLKRIFVNTSP
uniref:THAP-type domain-containing protein n=1 Tax=Megaselia scalaris TaxID=36166 RepID=T1GL02_MEGSC